MTNTKEFNDVTKIGSTVKNMPLSMLHVCPVQRGKNEKHVAKIVKEFDNRRIGVFSVVKFDGKFVIIDGMHRYYALHEICKMQGVSPDDVFLESQVYDAKDEIELCALLEKLNSDSRPLTAADYLFSQKNVPGTAGYDFMNLLDRLDISLDRSSSKYTVVLTAIGHAFPAFIPNDKVKREIVEDALRLLRLVADQKVNKKILTSEFDVMMGFVRHGGDLKSAQVQNAVIRAGPALFFMNDDRHDLSSKERLNRFITVLDLYMRNQNL